MPAQRPTRAGATPRSAAATAASTEGTASAIAVSACTASVMETVSASRAVLCPAAGLFNFVDAVACPPSEDRRPAAPRTGAQRIVRRRSARLLRSTLEFVMQGRRCRAGVGPYEAIIGRLL